jgi:hypothetical protein
MKACDFRKLTHQTTMKVTLHMTREIKFRIFVAKQLLKLVALILGCGIEIVRNEGE